MSALLAGALYAALALATGYAIVCWSTRETALPRARLAGASLALGIGALSAILFAASALGLAPRPGTLLACGLAAAGALAWRSRRGGLVRPRRAPASGPRAARALAALWLLPLAGVALEALGSAPPNVDFVVIWGLKAKLLYYEAIAGSDYFRDVALSFSHLDYPLLVPLAEAATYALRGTVDETLGRSVQVLLFAALALLLRDALRERLRDPRADLLLLAYLANPWLLIQSGAGIADLALMVYYAAALAFLFRWVEGGGRGDLVLGSLASAGMVFSKNEGLALWLANGLVLLAWLALSRRRAAMRGLAAHAVGVLALSAPWLVFRAGIPKTHENYGARLRPGALLDHLDRTPEILSQLGAALFSTGSPWADGVRAGLWLVLAVALATGWRGLRRGRVAAAWGCLALHLGCYFAIFAVSPWEVARLAPMKMYPLLLQASPLALLLVAEHWAALGGGPAPVSAPGRPAPEGPPR